MRTANNIDPRVAVANRLVQATKRQSHDMGRIAMAKARTKSKIKTAAGSDGAQAIHRAVDVLRAVVLMQGNGATLMRISRATNLSRSTTFRILRTLADERLLAFDAERHLYSIGPLAYEIGLATSGQSQLTERWDACLHRINRASGLTTYLIARSGTDIVCLASVQGSTIVRAIPMRVGQRAPLGIGAGSLAILSSLEDEEIDAVLKANVNKVKAYSNGKLTPQILLERVKRTRAKGYACSTGTLAQGVTGIGLVIDDNGNFTRLAISVAIAGTEISEKEQARIVTLMRDAIRQESRTNR
jgi:DNA-binding IclR family transcriptional regulator